MNAVNSTPAQTRHCLHRTAQCAAAREGLSRGFKMADAHSVPSYFGYSAGVCSSRKALAHACTPDR